MFSQAALLLRPRIITGRLQAIRSRKGGVYETLVALALSTGPEGTGSLLERSIISEKVLAVRTKGYRNHPQLQRFRNRSAPPSAIAAFLNGLAEEATKRGYTFNTTLILAPPTEETIPLASGS